MEVNKEKTASFTVKIKAKQSNKANIHDIVCVHVGIESNTVLPESEECGRNERKDEDGTTNVRNAIRWMVFHLRSVRTGKSR